MSISKITVVGVYVYVVNKCHMIKRGIVQCIKAFYTCSCIMWAVSVWSTKYIILNSHSVVETPDLQYLAPSYFTVDLPLYQEDNHLVWWTSHFRPNSRMWRWQQANNPRIQCWINLPLPMMKLSWLFSHHNKMPLTLTNLRISPQRPPSATPTSLHTLNKCCSLFHCPRIVLQFQELSYHKLSINPTLLILR